MISIIVIANYLYQNRQDKGKFSIVFGSGLVVEQHQPPDRHLRPGIVLNAIAVPLSLEDVLGPGDPSTVRLGTRRL